MRLKRVKPELIEFLLTEIIIIIFLLTSAGKALGTVESLPVMKVSYSRSIDDLPLYVGLEEGFWEREGLKVKLVRVVGETHIIASAMHGDIQAGHMDLSSACHAALKKIPVKIVTWLGRAHLGTRCGLHADARSRIFNVADLKGKRIATSGSISTEMFLFKALATAGLTFDDIKAVRGIKLDEAMKHEAALKSKGVDVIVA